MPFIHEPQEQGPVRLTAHIEVKRKCIISHAVGTDHIDLAYCRQANIQVMTCTGCNTESVAEHALSLYFAARRSLVSIHNTLADFGPDRPNDWKSKGECLLGEQGTATHGKQGLASKDGC